MFCFQPIRHHKVSTVPALITRLPKTFNPNKTIKANSQQ